MEDEEEETYFPKYELLEREEGREREESASNCSF